MSNPALATCILVCAAALSFATGAQTRGELLYSTHCIACHTTQVHWREQKLATDWRSLQAQVARWQAVGALGWSDQDISPLASVNFYKSTTSALGESSVSKSMRLFMVPGMGHCGGGEGPNTFDMVAPLDQWVEHGQAPAQVEASHSTNGKVDRTRPLCPYPQVARYTGTGSIDAAQNFVCRLP